MLEKKKRFKENKPLIFLVSMFTMMMCLMCTVLVHQCIMEFTNDTVISYAMSGDEAGGRFSSGEEEKGGDGWRFYDADMPSDGWSYHVPDFSDEEENSGINETASMQAVDASESHEAVNEEENFNPVVKKSQEVSDEYFKNTLFMGDSRTQGLQYQCGIDACYVTDVGMNVGEFFDRRSISVDGKKYTMAEALTLGEYDNVYLMFGINEVGWPNVDAFVEYYRGIIDEVQKTQPDAVVYVQSILYCTEEKAEDASYFGRKRINYYNRLLKKLAKSEHVYFLDINECLVDQTGVLPDEASPDGIHLNMKYCKKWLKYLKTHTV